ncbi:MAG: InlB B-repeat-containing protein [Candidatus Scatosoma sp.]
MRKKSKIIVLLCLLACLCSIFFAACDKEKSAYSVKFLNDDGTQIGTTQTVSSGEEFTVPEDPEKEGYDFCGWTVDGILYDFSAEGAKKAEKDMTFTATYEAAFTVSFYDGETLISTKRVKEGTRIKPPQYEKKGYTFKFWSKEGESAAFNFNAVISENVKLIANVTANKYTVKFFDEDGVTPLGGDNAEQTLDYATAFVVPEPPEKAHKTFVGWQIPGEETMIDLTAEGANLITDQNVSYVAKYAVDKYKIIFYAEDGTTVLYETVAEYGTIPVYKGEEPVKTEDGKKWVFAGWSPKLTAANGEASYTATFREYTVKSDGGDVYDNDRDDWF